MNTFQNHIVVPIDFSEQAKIALTQTYNLARATGADITLLHVVDEDLFSTMMNLFTDKEEKEAEYMNEISKKLHILAEETEASSGLTVNIQIEKGKIYEVVNQVAKDINAAFIVMGTAGETTIKKKFIGSNAVRVIGDAPCPVITIKGQNHRTGCKTIVLPLDLSRETKEKVGKCIEIARFFKSEVKVMTTVDTEDEFLVNRLQRQMDQVLEFLTSHQIKCTGEFVPSDDISDGVLAYSKQVSADLIIIMTQQELEFRDYFIGTESSQIINHSEIPVCSIRPIKRKDTTEFVIQ